MYGRSPYYFIDDPILSEKKMGTKNPTLTGLELTRLKRCQTELRALQDRLETKTTDEWNPTHPDSESMFILCSIESARKNIDLALEHHELYREPRMPTYDWDHYKRIFDERFDKITYEELFNTVHHRGTRIIYPPEEKDEE
jgi:hypothetical protein